MLILDFDNHLITCLLSLNLAHQDHFPFADFIKLVKMAVNSLDSYTKEVTLSDFKRLPSMKSSNQKPLSSASSRTTPSFDINFALDLALQADL